MNLFDPKCNILFKFLSLPYVINKHHLTCHWGMYTVHLNTSSNKWNSEKSEVSLTLCLRYLGGHVSEKMIMTWVQVATILFIVKNKRTCRKKSMNSGSRAQNYKDFLPVGMVCSSIHVITQSKSIFPMSSQFSILKKAEVLTRKIGIFPNKFL